MTNRFKAAVESIECIADCYCTGKQALSNSEKTKVSGDGATLHGSVNIDEALRPKQPCEHRWDYAVCHSTDQGFDQFISWVEIHPATPAEAKVVLQKKQSLMKWLEAEGAPLAAFECTYVWLASNNVGIPKNAPELRRLATRGILGPCKYFRLYRTQCS